MIVLVDTNIMPDDLLERRFRAGRLLLAVTASLQL